MNRLITFSLTVLMLAGCAIGPDYRKPDAASPPAWLVDMQQAKDTANTVWWEQFNDPALNDLIMTALKENYDLRTPLRGLRSSTAGTAQRVQISSRRSAMEATPAGRRRQRKGPSL